MDDIIPSAAMPVSQQDWYHNWLYSVLPGGSTNGIYLVGYCKNCRKAFTNQLPIDVNFNVDEFSYFETQLDIPKSGCVSPA